MQTTHFERKRKKKLKKIKKKTKQIIILLLIIILIILQKANNIHICITDNYFTFYKKTNEISTNDYIVFKDENNNKKVAKVVKNKSNNLYVIQFDNVRFYEKNAISKNDIYGKKIARIYNIFSIFKYKQTKIILIIILIMFLVLAYKRMKIINKRDKIRNSL